MMIRLRNDRLEIEIDTKGAQLRSIRDMHACEYLWQGDARYWSDSAPILFPFIGRLFQKKWQHKGTEYQMDIHGFASASGFSVKEQSVNRAVLSLCSNEETYRSYPFDFAFDVEYELVADSVEVTFTVTNPGAETLPFAAGGHPGFNVPLENGLRFEDYVLEFSQECQPVRIGFSPDVLLNGHDEPFGLTEGKYLFLSHGLFDDDAIILKNMPHEVVLHPVHRGRALRLSFPDMPYLGIWHCPGTSAPYVCIEPWTSLPARQDVIEDFSCKSDMIHLAPGCTYSNKWSITTIQEEKEYD